jgi:hypothetical protein
MSRLENLARPIMISLIKGEKIRLSPHHQAIVATWATLKAMVAEYGDSEYVTTHHMQRKYLMRHRSPPATGWAIWIAHFHRQIWGPHWLSRPFLAVSDERIARYPGGLAPYFNSHSTTQVIGQLFIQIVRSPVPNFVDRWRFSLPRGQALFRIWPPSGYSIPWPAGTINDGTAQYIGDAVKEFLARVVAIEAVDPPYS